MTTLRAAAEKALDALLAIEEDPHGSHSFPALANDAIAALRTALAESPDSTNPVVESEPLALNTHDVTAEPVSAERAAEFKQAVKDAMQRTEPMQEPVAWMCADEGLAQKGYSRFSRTKEGAWNIPVYTHPAPQPVTLTDEEVLAILGDLDPDAKRLPPGLKAFTRAIERAHGIGGEA